MEVCSYVRDAVPRNAHVPNGTVLMELLFLQLLDLNDNIKQSCEIIEIITGGKKSGNLNTNATVIGPDRKMRPSRQGPGNYDYQR
jgi:hypothetical protein